MTTKEYLQQIGKLNKMINNKMIELSQMKEMAYSIKAVGTDERVMSSSDPDKTGCAYAKIEEMEEKINGMIDNYVDTKEKIINQIESIEDENLYNILFLKYIAKNGLKILRSKLTSHGGRQSDCTERHSKNLKKNTEKNTCRVIECHINTVLLL